MIISGMTKNFKLMDEICSLFPSHNVKRNPGSYFFRIQVSQEDGSALIELLKEHKVECLISALEEL